MIEIALDADEEWDSSTGWDAIARRAAEAAVAESAFPQLVSGSRPVEISVRLTGDAEVQSLNSQWRGNNKPTNVLSFPMAEAQDLNSAKIAEPELLLGDIVLARGVCVAEAKDKSIGVEHHVAHLIVHGTLHLLGYDHHDEGEAEDMEAREIRALERMGIANPYEVAA